jgi:hypothetical protein
MGANIGGEHIPNASRSSQSRERVRNGVRERECLACAGWFSIGNFYVWGGRIISRCKPCMRSIVYMQRDARKVAKLASGVKSIKLQPNTAISAVRPLQD